MRSNRANITLQLLYSLTAGGFQASFSLIAEQVLKQLEQDPNQTTTKRQVMRTLYGLRDRGMLVFSESHRQWTLSDKGRRRAKSYVLNDLTFPSAPVTWDGRWRLIAFDVPEESGYLRAIFRRKLQSLGCQYIQRSLWVYPYPCKKELRELASRLGLERDIVIAVTSDLQPDNTLLKKFKLHR